MKTEEDDADGQHGPYVYAMLSRRHTQKKYLQIIWPGQPKTCPQAYVESEGPDQPVHV